MLSKIDRDRFINGTDEYRAEQLLLARGRYQLALEAWLAHVAVEKAKVRIALRPLWEASAPNTEGF